MNPAGPVLFVTDCNDPNARLRLSGRCDALFGHTPTVEPVSSNHSIELAGQIVDAIDGASCAKQTRRPIVLGNQAPRNKANQNGCPFAYVVMQEAIVVSTLGEYTFSMLKKVGLLGLLGKGDIQISGGVQVMDIHEVARWAQEKELVTDTETDRWSHTQFRSLEFEPYIGRFLNDNENVPWTRSIAPGNISNPPLCVWYVDCFGNCKTTLLLPEFERLAGKNELLQIPFHRSLHKVPRNEPGWIVGSSGFGDFRFLELVVRGESAARLLNLEVGSTIVA